MKNKWIVALSALITAAAVAGIVAVRSERSRPDHLTDPIARGVISENVYGIGTITANKSFQLKSGVAATLLHLFVKEGDSVRRGQRLAVSDEGIPFVAPFDGTVTSVPIKVGETIFPQTVIFQVVDLLDRYVVVSLEQRAAIRVRRGQKARLSFENLRDTFYEGTVESVYSHQNNFLVRINAPTLPPQILPGMTADVAIGISERRDVLLVPVAAIEGTSVFVKRDGHRLQRVDIKTGIVDGAMAELLEGNLKEGDKLAVRHKVRP